MNKIFRVVWSHALQSYIVTSEIAKSRGKPASSVKRMATVLAGTLMAHQVVAAPVPDALPTGGQVVTGQAAISQTGSTMNIQQGSDKAILNWQSFNIGSNASVNFQQPGSNSVALNRVMGSDPSAIYGSLTANGQVFLVNPNGVLFGQGARVDVGGLVASTLDISDADFLGGTYQFNRGDASAGVTNLGELYGEYIALLAPEVINDGVIVANQGTVALAAGDAVTLDISGNRLIDVAVDQASIDTLIENRHLVQADDGTILMSAQSAKGLLGQVVNSGAVEAQGIVNDGGVIRLLASDSIDHSGSISADGGIFGNGGKAILLASLSNPDSTTTVSGGISAMGGNEAGDGGFIETSGTHLKIESSAGIDTTAPNGQTGQWLLDPDDFTVAAAGGDITGTALGTLLDTNNVIIQTTAVGSTCTAQFDGACGTGGTAGNGDIFINDTVSWTGATTLGLDAYRNIEINGSLSYDFMFASVNIGYGSGGSGKALVGAGVDTSLAGLVFDSTNGQITDLATIDNSRDYYIGTVNVPIYVQLISGTGSYGDTNLPVGYFDAAGGNRININDPGSSVTWSTDPSTLNVGGPYSLSYVSGISSNYYSSFAAGNAANWSVTARAIELTASDQSKTYGDTLNLGSTAFTLTSGSYAYSETATAATLASATGKAGDTAAVANTYNNEITISGATGSGGFNTSNYNISYVAGDLTVNKATLTYTADAASMTAGDGVPALSGNVSGFVNGENQAGATTGTLAFATPATSSSSAGSYAIDGSGLAATNYDFDQAAGNATALTVNAATSTPQTAANNAQRRAFDNTSDNLSESDPDENLQNWKKLNIERAKKSTPLANTKTDMRHGVKQHCGECSVTSEEFDPSPVTLDVGKKTILRKSPVNVTPISSKARKGNTNSGDSGPQGTTTGNGTSGTSGIGDPQQTGQNTGSGNNGAPKADSTQAPKLADMKGSIADKEVRVKGNPPAKLDKAGLRDMINRFAETHDSSRQFNDETFAKVQNNVMLTLNYAKLTSTENGLDSSAASIGGTDFAPSLSGVSPEQVKSLPEGDQALFNGQTTLTDGELNRYFKKAERFKDVPLSTVVAYLNTTSDEGGKKEFWLEDGKIVSGPSPRTVTKKVPQYHVSAKTNLKPGTEVTVAFTDASGKTKTTKATVGEDGSVKTEGPVGDLKQPLKARISSEQPKYESDPITLGETRKPVESTKPEVTGQEASSNTKPNPALEPSKPSVSTATQSRPATPPAPSSTTPQPPATPAAAPPAPSSTTPPSPATPAAAPPAPASTTPPESTSIPGIKAPNGSVGNLFTFSSASTKVEQLESQTTQADFFMTPPLEIYIETGEGGIEGEGQPGESGSGSSPATSNGQGSTIQETVGLADTDGDGTPDATDPDPFDPEVMGEKKKNSNTEGDNRNDNGNQNLIEPKGFDSDGDGVPDSRDAFPFDPALGADEDN